jgi:hemerythrin
MGTMTKPGALPKAPHTASAEDELRRLRARLDAEVATRQGVEQRLAQVQAAYARFVPPQLLDLLAKESILDVDWGNQAEKKMTILFSDIRGFASMSERMSPQQCFDFINAYLSFMEPVVLAHGGFIDKYIGDSVMALFPARGDDALRAALGMLAELDQFNAQRAILMTELPADHPERRAASEVKIGIGLNSGLLMLGVIGGTNRMEVTVISDAVNLASRVETLTKTYQTPILITIRPTSRSASSIACACAASTWRSRSTRCSTPIRRRSRPPSWRAATPSRTPSPTTISAAWKTR